MRLRILRFTPTASAIINLILSDVGRPVGHLVSNLVDYNRMVQDTQAVLDTLIPKEVDVQTTEGKWFTMRIQPYRTLDNVIEGAVITFVDITEMKQMGQALQESETRLREVLDNSQDVAYKRNLQTNAYEYQSPVLTRVAGYTPAEMQALPLEKYLELVSADDRAEIERVITEALAGATGKAYQVAYRFKHKNGQYRWFQDHFKVMRDAGGQNLALIGSVSDITERRQAEEELQKADQKIRTMVDSITDGLLVLDHQWVYTYFSETGANIIGMRREDVLGKCVWDLFPLAKDTKFEENYRRAMETGQSNHFEEYYSEPVNKWLECHCFPSTDGLSVYFHDITERRQAEESLRKANQLLRLAVVVRDAHDAITVQDLEGRTLAWNPGAVRLYGWSEAEALTMNVHDRIPEGFREDALAKVHQLSLAEILEPYRTQRLTRDGRVLDVSLISTVLVDEAGNHYAITTTERPIESLGRAPISWTTRRG